MKQIHHEELEGGDEERPSAFPKIMLKQTDSHIQQLHGAGEEAVRSRVVSQQSERIAEPIEVFVLPTLDPFHDQRLH